MLATILHSEIALVPGNPGDGALAGYHGAADRDVAAFRGRLLASAGGSLVATFDGPARAVRCAEATWSPDRRSASPIAAAIG